jgi:hypothetical protein
MVAEASKPLLSAALSYVRRGWPVLPLRRGEKVPDGRLVPHGLNDATTDEARITVSIPANPYTQSRVFVHPGARSVRTRG